MATFEAWGLDFKCALFVNDLEKSSNLFWILSELDSELRNVMKDKNWAKRRVNKNKTNFL